MSPIRNAYERGRGAFYQGRPLASPFLRHLPEDEAWRAGWEDASGFELGEGHQKSLILDGQLDFWEETQAKSMDLSTYQSTTWE